MPWNPPAWRHKPTKALHSLSCWVHKPQKVYTFSVIVGNIIPKSVKRIHSATKDKCMYWLTSAPSQQVTYKHLKVSLKKNNDEVLCWGHDADICRLFRARHGIWAGSPSDGPRVWTWEIQSYRLRSGTTNRWLKQTHVRPSKLLDPKPYLNPKQPALKLSNEDFYLGAQYPCPKKGWPFQPW